MRNTRWIQPVILLSLATLLFAGCGPDNPKGTLGLTGTVTFQGQPLAQGTIEFTSTGGEEGAAAMTGTVIENGSYSIPAHQGVPPGDYRVRISSSKEAAGAPPEMPGMPEEGAATPEELIPPEYSSSESTQQVTVSSDKTEFNFDIP